MIDSYEVGQKLTAEDFVGDYYFPDAKYDYCKVKSIDGDAVVLEYTNEGRDLVDTVSTTKADVEKMLGWGLVQGDDDIIEIDAPAGQSTDGIKAMALHAKTAQVKGEYELLENVPMYVRSVGGKLREIHAFKNRYACVREFNRL